MDKPTTIIVKKQYNCWHNTVKCNPNPKYRTLINGLNKMNEDKSVGNTLNYIIKDYFDKMPTEQRMRLMHEAKNHY